MSRRPPSSPPRRAGRGTLSTRRALTALGGLAVLLTSAIGLAPAASAALPPLPPGPATTPIPSPPPAAATPAHLPLWAVVALVAGTVVLSIATTLITLGVEHLRRARHTPAAAADPQAAVPSASATSGPEAGQGEILGTYHMAGYDSPGDR